jgi:hypothetical protein
MGTFHQKEMTQDTLRLLADEHTQRMKRQKLEIGHPLAIEVTWYDNVPEPPQL